MKKYRLWLILISAFFLFSPIVFAKELIQTVSSGNGYLVSSNRTLNLVNNLSEFPSPVYDFFDEEGFYNSVYRSNTEVFWTKYDETLNPQVTMHWPLYYDKSGLGSMASMTESFGGAIYDNGYLYVVYAKPALEGTRAEQYQRNVLAIGKYDKKGNLVKLKEYLGVQINPYSYDERGLQIPFYAGNSSMAMSDGILMLFLGGNMFMAHQGSYLLAFDSDSLDYLSNLHEENISTERWRKYFYIGTHQISHSLAQRIIKTSDGKFLMAEFGDASKNRGLVLTKLYDYHDSELDADTIKLGSKRMFHFSEGIAGKNGNNALNATMGSILELSDGYLYVGAMHKELSASYGSALNGPWDLVVQKYQKNFYTMDDVSNAQMLSTPVRRVTGVKSEEVSSQVLYLNGDEEDYGLKFLSSLSDTSVDLVRAVKVDHDRVAIFFEEAFIEKGSGNAYLSNSKIDTYYMVIDKDANVVVPKTKLDHTRMNTELSLCYRDGYIYFTTVSSTEVVVNRLNLYGNDKKVAFLKNEANLQVGGHETLKVIKNSNDTVTYRSTNPSVLSVNSKGEVTALKKGNAVITVTSKNGDSATCRYSVFDYIKGDMDQDGDIDILDVMIALRIHFGIMKSNSTYVSIGDMNENGKVDIVDVLAILRQSLKIA